MRFATVTGTDLLRRKVTLPDDLQGELNILFLAFFQWHQALVDGWVPFAQQLEGSFPGLKYYEIPVIYKMNVLSQSLLNAGMRAGIPHPTTRQKTITLYLDKAAFRTALDIPDEETIRVLLLDRQGDIAWRADGAFSVEKGVDLLEAIQELSGITAAESKS